ncbi:MAG: immunoglobulin-like domain-containing protein, partial [bacterium]
MRKFLQRIIKKFRSSNIWLIDKKNLSSFYRIRVRDKKIITNFKITNLKNQLTIKYKIMPSIISLNQMKNLLKKINKERKNIFFFLKQIKKIKRTQLVGLVLIFSVVSFFYNPKPVHAACALSGTIATSYNWAGCAGEATISGSVTFAAGTHNLGATNLTINSGGTLIPAPSSTTVNGATGVTINTTGNITVASGGTINGNGQGYTGRSYASGSPLGQGYGEGGGTRGYYGGAGGAHGGAGGKGNASSVRNTTTYGSATNPVSLGSASGASNGTNIFNPGGGAIKLNASGTVTINGTVSANGNSGTGTSAGGAGGSVWIVAGTLTGSNSATISANGGDGAGTYSTNAGGGGGGGRISLQTSGTDTYAGSIIVEGGLGLEGGEAGTLERTVGTPGDIIIAAGSTVTWTRGEHTFHDLTIQSTGVLTTGEAEAAGGGNNSNGPFIGGGPGPGLSGDKGGGGGGHVGAGGTEGGGTRAGVGGSAYNSDGLQVTQPTDMGSAGGGSAQDGLGSYGGGAIKLTITGTLTVNGKILADGQSNGTSGGGSGGSIWINAPTGTVNSTGGEFSAHGGVAGTGTANNGGGGGSGGRIAFNAGTKNLSAITVDVAGGTGVNNGGDGTVSGLLYSSITSPTSAARNTFTSVTGTAADYSGATLGYVDVSIYNGSQYWNGSSFNQASEYWLRATGTSSWSYAVSGLTSPGVTLTVHSRAKSGRGVESFFETPGTGVTFNLDTVAPTLATVTAIPTATNDNTPNYIFSSTEAGTITYGGSCSSATTSATSGSNTVTFNTLTDGTYSNCTVTVTDAATNASSALSVPTFTVDTVAPTAPIAVTFTATGGNVLANTLNSTNTNFTAGATITAADATGGTAELLKGGASFSPAIMDSSISAGDTTVTFNAGLASNAAVQTAFASGAALSVRLCDLAGNCTTSSVSNPTITVDYIAPTNQDSVLTADAMFRSSGTVTIASSGNATNNIWIAPLGTTSFTAGSTMTTAGGTSTTILSPSAEGTYRLYVIDAAGNVSAASTHTVIVDSTAPTPSAPTNTAQRLNSESLSNSTVQINEAGTIYLVKTGTGPVAALPDTANLTNMVISNSPSNYTFSGGTYNYNGVTVLSTVTSVTVTPTGAGTITVNGMTVTSGQASGAIALTAGVERVIDVVATESGKNPRIYTIRIIRGPTLGTSWQGGKVAYVNGSGGFIVTDNDITSADNASCSAVHPIGQGQGAGTGSAIGTGKANTDALVALCGAGPNSATVAHALVLNGYSDWYVPSSGEFITMSLNKNAINANFVDSTNYWSSTTSGWLSSVTCDINGYSSCGGSGYNVIKPGRAIRDITITPTLPTPTFSLSGAVAHGSTVTITSAGADAIYYTTDGSTPTTSSTNQATTPLVINGPVTVKALAVKANYYNASSLATFTEIFDWNNEINVDHTAFIGKSSAVADIPYRVTLPAGLVDGVYDIIGVDLVGNTSNALAGWLTVDNTAPTLATVTAVTNPTNDNTPNYIFSSTEAGTISYAGSCSSATTSATSGSNTITFTTLTDGTYSNCTVTVTDAATNTSSLLSVPSFTVDTAGPTVTLTSNDPDPTNGTINVRATFGESTTNFVVGDITVTNGTAGNFTGSGMVYDFEITPTTDGTVSVDVNAGVATDAAGNPNSAATQLTRLYDSINPTSTITPICSTPGNGCTPAGEAQNPPGSYGVRSIVGSASDATGGAGVSTVEISIKDTNANVWYSGTSFSDVSETYLPVTTGTTTWSYNSSGISLEIGHVYQVNVRATDGAGNVESPVQTLSFEFTNSPPTVSNVSASQNSSGVVSVSYNVTDNESTQTSNSLFYWSGSTLSGNISSAVTSLTTSNVTSFPTSGTILIDDEIINYASKSGNVLQGLTRGSAINYPTTSNTTTPFAHSSGAQIFIYATSATGDIGLLNKGTGKNITWTASADADGYENINEIIKVVANDGSTGSMVGSSLSSIFILDAAKPTINGTTLLINDTDADVISLSPNITLKLQNITGHPVDENIFVQFSRDGGTTWYGANADGTLSGSGTMGTGFSSSLTVIGALSWPWTMTSRSETITVKITDSYGNYAEDTNTVGYNAPPEFNVDYPSTSAGGLSVVQVADKNDANFGKVKIEYSIRDTDTDVDTVPGFVTPTFSYNTGSGWNTINDVDIVYATAPTGGQIIDQNTDGVRDNKVSTSSYYIYTAYWTPTTNIETATAQFKLSISDLETNNSTTTKEISNLLIDSKKPVVTPITFDAGIAGSPESALVTIPMPTDLSSVQYKIKDDSSNSNPQDTGWKSINESTTIPWTFDSVLGIKTLKYQFRDAYENTTNEVSTSTLTPVDSNSFVVQDASNPRIPSYDMYISWKAITDATGFDSYKLEFATSTDNSFFSSYQSIGTGMDSSTTNYFVHRSLDPTKYYRYRLGVVGTNGNISVRSGGYVTAKPDGIQNFGEGSGGGSVAAASQVENVVPVQGSDKNVTVTYKLTDPSLSNKTDPLYEARVFYNIGITLPTNADAGGNIKVSDASKLKSSGYIQINNEVIKYTGKSENTLTGITRGTWPTDITTNRVTRQNPLLFAGTPVWVMASTTAINTIANNSIAYGQNGTITWTTYDESALAGGVYNNVGIRVLVHDNQDAGSGPLSSQSDYSENGILNILDLNTPTIGFDTTHSSGLESVTPAVFTINLNRIYPSAVSVDYTVAGTAVGGGTDYTLVNGTATITAGQTTTSLSAVIVNHNQVRPNKTIIITLSNPVNATLGANSVHTYTIINHDTSTTPPTVTIVPPSVMHVLSGTVWADQDPGATATDTIDGDLTSSIVVTGAPSMNTPSTTPYTVTYSATNSSGQTGTATREVYVDDANAATFEITAIQSTGGLISPENATTVQVHSDQAYTITPDEWYKVDSITIDTNLPLAPTAGVNHYTFTDVTAPHTITAAFSALPDTTPPVILITGPTTVQLTVGDTYSDQGATASDTYLGVTTPLTDSIEVFSNVNNLIPGTYQVRYTVSDSAGNTATATRTVVVSYNET